MSMHVPSGHFSYSQFADHNMPPAPESLREAFRIPMHPGVSEVSSHTSASASHLLLKQEEGQ